MSVAKCLFAYTVCAIALVVYQTGAASAADPKCYNCNSNSTDDQTKLCDEKAINDSNTLDKVPMVTNCVTYMYTVDGHTNYTVRTTNIDCGEKNKSLHDLSVTKFSCDSCKADLCNNKEISLSGGVTFGFNVVTLLLSIVLALYCIV